MILIRNQGVFLILIEKQIVMAKKVILTGATGMVGEGVLHVCLSHPAVEEVLVIGRRRCEVDHPKLREIILPDVSDLSAVEDQLVGYDACFFCLGISSVGMTSEAYYQTTYTLTLRFAQTVARLNPGLVFCYVSGAGTDRTGTSRLEWARVKGKTENDLDAIPGLKVYGLRPGFIKPIKGMKHTSKYYKYVMWMYPFGRLLYPNGFCTMEELALAMIRLSKEGFGSKVISGKDLIKLAHEN